MLDSTLRKVVSEVFRIPPEDVDDELSPDTLDDWDSLSHLRLVTALEEAFSIKFESSEIMDLTTVGAIRESLAVKTAAAT
ncbi:MAG TPA: acyl carrier protein [Labilithrix sp.]|nr:acyl carrier protein [Labilithrix sp.]